MESSNRTIFFHSKEVYNHKVNDDWVKTSPLHKVHEL